MEFFDDHTNALIYLINKEKSMQKIKVIQTTRDLLCNEVFKYCNLNKSVRIEDSEYIQNLNTRIKIYNDYINEEVCKYTDAMQYLENYNNIYRMKLSQL